MTNRRLIGPTAICLVISGLLADHLYLSQSRWSVLAFLSRIVSIIAAIFGPALNPALYGWLNDVLVPATMIVLALVLLWLTVARAKGAMSKATLNVDEVVLLAAPKSIPIPQPAEAAELVPSTPSSPPWKWRLAWKLTISFGALALTFGGIVSIIAYTRVASMLEKEMKHRASLSAMMLSEIATSYGAAHGKTGLRRAIENHLSNDTVAYIYVEDAEGKIIEHLRRELPEFLRQDAPESAVPAVNGVDMEYRGLPVFEISAPVGEPRGGFVHLAIWSDRIHEETRRALMPIVTAILILLCGISAVFAWVVSSLTSPFSELVLYADRISHGELDLDIAIKEKSDEVRDLARSFARMRSSLYAVLIRLNETQPTNHSNEIS
ncbi:MAG: HAMP domain-containing protein [Candidatus Binatia bacterium]